jgi:hypothetical protein
MATKPRILIIEDDEKLGLALRSALDECEVTLKNRKPLSPADIAGGGTGIAGHINRAGLITE